MTRQRPTSRAQRHVRNALGITVSIAALAWTVGYISLGWLTNDERGDR